MRTFFLLFYIVTAALSLSAQTTSNVNNPAPACQLRHVMGGDISVHNDSGYFYTMTVMVYRDTVEFPLAPANLIDIYTYDITAGEYLLDSSINVAMDTPLYSSLLHQSPFGCEAGYYTTHLYLPPGNYQFVYVSCCRNPLINNTATPATEFIVFHTEMEVYANSKNSSPYTILTPPAYLPVNSKAVFNPLLCDDDADSVSCNLITPMGNYTSSITSNFANVIGFTPPPSAPSGNFSMNPVSGEITWTPNAIGNFIQSFQIKEFRGGVQIGSETEDMEFVVVSNPGNDSLTFSNVSPVLYNADQNYNYLVYTPGQQLNFQINGATADTNITLSMDAFGTVFKMSNPAVFAINGVGNNISGTLSWTPPSGFSDNVTVVFRLRGQGNMFMKDYTLLLRSNNTSTNVAKLQTNIDQVKVYPNPAHNNVHLSVNVSETTNSDISLNSVLGQKVVSIFNGNLQKGTYDFNKEINLPDGIYYLVVRDNGRVIDTHCLVVE